ITVDNALWEGVFSISFTIPTPITAGSTTVVTVTCDPSQASAGHTLKNFTGTLNITTNDSNKLTESYPLTCSGTELTEPLYDSAPLPGNEIYVGSTVVGNTISKTFLVREIGNADLTVNLPATIGDNFAISSATNFPILEDGDDVIVTVECTPTVIGATHIETLQLTTNSANYPAPEYTLKCIGKKPKYSTTNNPLQFGNLPLRQTQNATFNIQEIGGEASLTVDLDTTSITGNNANDFKIMSPSFPFTINPSSSQTITIECESNTPLGSHTATLNFITDDPDNPNPTHNLECTTTEVVGAGYSSTPTKSGDTIDFGITNVNTPITKSFDIQEVGTMVLNIGLARSDDIAIVCGNVGDSGAKATCNATTIGIFTGSHKDDFSIVSSPGFPFYIDNGSTSSNIVTIQCNPSASGMRTATLNLVSSDIGKINPTYPLTCTAESPPEEVINEDTNITTTLPSELTLTVNFAGDGNGKFNGIDCKTESCSQQYETASKVNLVITPDSDSIFERWGGSTDCNDAEVFMVKNITCTAYFKLKNPPVEPEDEPEIEPKDDLKDKPKDNVVIVDQPIIKPTCTQATKIVYVNQAAQGHDNGLNWQDAFVDLQDALEAARNTCQNIKQIWIAQGTYYPTANNDRNI
ncbi:MAG: choice-of-anchor D domain-containing protein, partial [Proteobacteria bacterium]|nr:choice-of-anchor D domain-containing protein [Pseudomonadota bacterium]